MPFVKKTSSRDAQHTTESSKIFIGRAEELHFFREYILKPEEPTYNIVSISGQGGVGKSTLLFRFIEDTQASDYRDFCLTALVNERQVTATDVMEIFADQLHLAGDFERALKQYKETVRKLQSQREATREAFLRQLTTDVAGSMVKDVPVVGGLLKEGVAAATGYFFDELHYRQLLKDAERLDDPLRDLTNAFVMELNRVTEVQITISSTRIKRQRRVILFFDTFEQLAIECAPWLLDYFLEADINSNVVLMIAGRDQLEDSIPDDPKRWLPYRDSQAIHSISLDSFTKEETRLYLAERNIVEEERVEAIWQLSHGLPLYLGFLTSNPQGSVDPTANVVANFLRWIPEKEQFKRRLALHAALFSRPFNQDELEVFTYISEADRPIFYRWLITQPFVRSNPQDGRYSYHELAQELFSRHLYQISSQDYLVTRKLLAEYYRTLLKQIEAEGGKEIYASEQWLELTLALIYQLFLSSDEVSHIEAIKHLLYASELNEQKGEIARLLRRLVNVKVQITSLARQTIEQCLFYLESKRDQQEFFQAAAFLIDKIARDSTFPTELQAKLYYTRGKAYFNLQNYERALADFEQAITLDPNVASYYGNRASLYQSLQDNERALTDFERAITLDPTIKEQERGSP